MNGLMLHCGASRVERAKVYETPTPESTETHYPIPHQLLIEQLEVNLKKNGFEIVQEAHGLTQDGARYFGMMEVKKSETHLNAAIKRIGPADHPGDYGLVIGLRNAHDMSNAASYAMGNRVFVCDNLSFSGEVLVGRRHTRYIERDLPLLIPRAFAALGHERVCMDKRIDAYKEFQIGDKDVNDLVVRALVDEKIFPATYLPKVIGEWREPSHDEFSPRTIWSLANAFTEVAKPTGERRGNPATLLNRTKNMYGFFDKQLGLSLPSREAVLTEGLEEVVTHNDAWDRN